MNEDQAKGAFKDVLGKAENAVGALTGDTKGQLSGKGRELSGRAQESYGDVKDKAGDYAGQVKEFAQKEPVKALAAAAGVGILVGLMLRRR